MVHNTYTKLIRHHDPVAVVRRTKLLPVDVVWCLSMIAKSLMMTVWCVNISVHTVHSNHV